MAGTRKRLKFQGLEAWDAVRETGGASAVSDVDTRTCHSRGGGGPTAGLLPSCSWGFCLQSGPSHPKTLPQLCSLSGWGHSSLAFDTVPSLDTVEAQERLSSPLLKKQIHSKAPVFALFWAFPQLLPARPSLQDPPLGRRETRAGLPTGPLCRSWARDSQCAQGHKAQPSGGVLRYVPQGLTDPKLHSHLETPSDPG